MIDNFIMTVESITFYTQDPTLTNYNFKRKGDEDSHLFGRVMIEMNEDNVDFSGFSPVNYIGTEEIERLSFNNTTFEDILEL